MSAVRRSQVRGQPPLGGGDLRVAAGVDVGGTFTDVVVIAPGARLRAVKVPTTPDDQGEGLQEGLRTALGGHGDAALVGHGTTTATNAILERQVARVVLVVTRGFADVLVIGRQDRPSLYDLRVTRPEPLVARSRVVPVAERTAADGSAVLELDKAEIDRVVAAVVACDPQAVAISLLFSWAGSGHERALCDALAARLPEVPITRSSVLLPEFREYERTSTCVLNAAVAPVMRRYLSRLAARLANSAISVMTSGGGTAGLEFLAEAPVHTLLSGPAAGVVAAAAVAGSAGFADALAFDMGGTSTDVCLITGGRPTIAVEAEIGGFPVRTPAVGVHTVGAGGGSIAWIDSGGALRVGPRSAGARPGPACYGLGGRQPTVTDAHCALGHFDLDRPLGGGALRLDPEAAERALTALPEGPSGILAVVRATMARALRRVSTERGVDPAGLALVAYGGAGPLHATALARELGCAAVVVPPAPGVLSALGLLLAPPRHEASRTVMASPSDDLSAVWSQLEEAARAELARQGAGGPITCARLADCRYAGQSYELRLPAGPGTDLAATLAEAHRTAYGYALPGEPVQVVTIRVTAEGRPVLPSGVHGLEWDQGPARPDRERRIDARRGPVTARALDRASLSPGDRVAGPALVEQPDSTTLLASGEQAEVDAAGNLVIRW
ncbi:MAG: hydantoinase/oxoprolinase family protein [Egibacteraceae bacterium]